MLDDRKLQVLYAIIDSYIHTGEPIGSRTITKKYNFGVSPATIRNEMSDLEELGFLGKPHTSSGRIPSDKAYRHYVDHFLAQNLLSTMQFHRIITQEQENVTADDGQSLLQLATNLLVQWTQYTAVGSFTDREDETLDHITLREVEAGLYLVVLAYTHRKARNHLMQVDEPIPEAQLKSVEEKVNNLLASGQKVETIRAELAGLLKEPDWAQVLHKLIENGLVLTQAQFVLNGLSNIFNFPEFQDADKAKEFLLFFEDMSAMSQLFTDAGDLVIRIGEENEEERLKYSSVLSASYTMQDGRVGKIALIGPTRMDYTKAVRAVYLITENLQSLFPTG